MKTLVKKFKGKKRGGKKVLLIAGVHGNEITPIYCVGMLMGKAPSQLNNILKHIASLTIVTAVNPSALLENQREIKDDDIDDLNRKFVNETKYDAHKFLQKHIKANDVVMDIHSSPSCADFALVDIDEYATCIRDWCRDANVFASFRHSGANTIKRWCLEQGKLAVTIELNKMSVIDYQSAKKGTEIIYMLVAHLPKKLYSSTPVDIITMREIKTHHTGILQLVRLSNNDNFQKGDILANILGLELNRIAVIRAEFDGWVVCESEKNFIKRGDVIAMVQ